MDIQRRMEHMGKGPFFLAVVATVLAIGGILTSFGPIGDGETYGYTRLALGVLGLIGAGLLVFGKDFGKTGWLVLMVWAVIQTGFYATEPDGNYTRQLVDGLIGMSSQTTINGEVSEYEAIGINIVGAAMTIWTYISKQRLDLWKRIAS